MMRFTATIFVSLLATVFSSSPTLVASGAVQLVPGMERLPQGNNIAGDDFQMYCAVQSWGNASCWYLRQGISYLHKLGDHPCHCEPNVATRISCEYGAGIFFENFGDDPIDVPCATLGDYAQDIVDTCGGEECDSDTHKPGLCINGVNECSGWSVFVMLQDC